MQFNATFNNISVISWQSVLMVEETGVPRENSCSIQTHYLDFCVCSYTVLLYAQRRSSKYQYYSLWFDLTGARAHNLPHNHVNHYTTDAAYQQFVIFPFFLNQYTYIVPTLSPLYRESIPNMPKIKIIILRCKSYYWSFRIHMLLITGLPFKLKAIQITFCLYKSALRKSSIQRYSIKQ